MNPNVLALGLALVTLAGYIWYVPALLALRAGEDRPLSHRTSAAACVTAWGTTAVMSTALFAGLPATAATVVGAAGYVTAAAVRLRAAAQAHRERTDARHWAALLHGGARS